MMQKSVRFQYGFFDPAGTLARFSIRFWASAPSRMRLGGVEVLRALTREGRQACACACVNHPCT